MSKQHCVLKERGLSGCHGLDLIKRQCGHSGMCACGNASLNVVLPGVAPNTQTVGQAPHRATLAHRAQFDRN